MVHGVPPACPWWNLTGGGTCGSCRFTCSPSPHPLLEPDVSWPSSRGPQAVRSPVPVTQAPASHYTRVRLPVGQLSPSCISFHQYLRVESLIFFKSCPNIPMLEWPCQNDTCAHPKCFVLFLQGQLGVPALPLGQRKGPGRGPASLLGHPLSPCPGSSGLVKNPGAWCLDTEDQVLQVKWWPSHPLKLSRAEGWAWVCTATQPLPAAQLLPAGSQFSFFFFLK